MRHGGEETAPPRRIAERLPAHDPARGAGRDRLAGSQRRRAEIMARFDADHAELIARLAR